MSMDSQVRGSINCHAGEKENGINQMGDLDRQRRKSSSQFECALGLMMSRRIRGASLLFIIKECDRFI